jgi:hypothetical protein
MTGFPDPDPVGGSLAGWCRRCADGPVEVLVGGAVAGRPGDGYVRLSLPPGGRGVRQAGLSPRWRRCRSAPEWRGGCRRIACRGPAGG